MGHGFHGYVSHNQRVDFLIKSLIKSLLDLVGGFIPTIGENKIHVPNHQPEIH